MRLIQAEIEMLGKSVFEDRMKVGILGKLVASTKLVGLLPSLKINKNKMKYVGYPSEVEIINNLLGGRSGRTLEL